MYWDMMQVQFLKHGNLELYIEEEVAKYKRVRECSTSIQMEKNETSNDIIHELAHVISDLGGSNHVWPLVSRFFRSGSCFLLPF